MNDTSRGEIDYKELRRHLIHALRGELSQNMLSRRLGYDFNQVWRWETGTREISWSQFAQLCRVCKAPLRSALLRGIGFHGSGFANGTLVTRHLTAAATVGEVAALTHVSRHRLNRWLKGQSEPDLEDILLLIHRLRYSLPQFLSHLVPSESSHILAEFFKKHQSILDARCRHLEAEAILRALTLQSYQEAATHDEALIARRVNTSTENVRRIIGELAREGSLKMVEGKYVCTVQASVPALRPYTLVAREHIHWSERGIDKLRRHETLPPRVRYAQTLLALNDEARAEIEQCLEQFLAQVQQIANRSPGSGDRVFALGFQFFDLSDDEPETAPLQAPESSDGDSGA